MADFPFALPAGYRLEEYEIARVLGSPGGFGITYLAWDTSMDGPVAIKEFFPSGYAHRGPNQTVVPNGAEGQEVYDWGYSRFIEEARVLWRLGQTGGHPNIVRVQRYLEYNKSAYIVMEYIEGEPLTAVLQEGRLSQAQWQQWLLPLLDGLQRVHDQGFLHRDIKPDNIMIRAAEQGPSAPVLIDFGAARPPTTGQTRVTQMHTPGYAATEQHFDRGKSQGPYTDIYAVACVTLYALTGEQPQDSRERILSDEMPALIERARDGADPGFIDALVWALALDSEGRPQSIAEWLPSLTGDVVVPSAPGLGESAQTPLERPKAGLGAASAGAITDKPARSPGRWLGAAVLVLVLAGAGVWWASQQTAQQEVVDTGLSRCDAMVAGELVGAAIRCYRGVLEGSPNNAAAQEKLNQQFAQLYAGVRRLIESDDYAAARKRLAELAELDADGPTLDALAQALQGSLLGKAEAALEANDFAETERWIAELESSAVPKAQIDALKSRLEIRRQALADRSGTLQACAAQQAAGALQEAFDCFGALVKKYPGAADRQQAVVSAIKEKVELALQAKDLPGVEAAIALARGVGLATADYEERLAAARKQRAQAAAAEAERLAAAARDKLIRADRARLTYGLQIEGQFEPGPEGSQFKVTRAGPKAQNLLSIRSGDVVEQLNRSGFTDLDQARTEVRSAATILEDFSAGVPDNRVFEALVIRPLDKRNGQARMVIRRAGGRVDLFCQNRAMNIRCR